MVTLAGHRCKVVPMDVLLIGGSGFVGSAVLRLLVDRDDLNVVALTRGFTPQKWTGVTHIACDRRDSASLQRKLGDRAFDVVIDVTAYEAVDVEPVLAVLANSPARYVMVSSAAVYDRRLCRPPFVEDAPATGDDIWGSYGVGKHRAEMALSDLVDTYILRPPYIYGPGNILQRERFLWSRMLTGETILVPGSGQTRLQMCSVGDLARLLVQAVDAVYPSGIYNVGEPSFLTFNRYIEVLAEAANLSLSDISISYVSDDRYPAREYFPFRDYDLVLDTTRFSTRNPGFRFVELLDGLPSTLEWLQFTDRLSVERNDVERELLEGG